MTDQSKIEAAAPELFAAVSYLLRRIGEDPHGMGYYAGLGTEVWGRALRAFAKATGRKEAEIRDDILAAQDRNANLEHHIRTLRRRVAELEMRT